MNIPSYVNTALDLLHGAGYEAFIVGGCVRDSLLGVTPNDWDITTSALPDAVASLFSDYKLIETGMAHGTVAVIIEDNIVEITTYRVDGEYLDNRHPSSVSFTSSLELDLARRDFTINAMAYSEDTGVVDPYGGQEDLAAGIIRAVGDPVTRFNEDALRIMRALRFASTLGFSIDDATGDAIRSCAELLSNVSCERITDELYKFMAGSYYDLLCDYDEVFSVIVPGYKVYRLDDFSADMRMVALCCNASTRGLRVSNGLAFGLRAVERYLGQDLSPIRLMLLATPKYAKLILCMEGKDYSVVDDLLASGACYMISNLAVSGDDLIGAGVPKGPMIGEILEKLLNMVVDGEVPNDFDKLMEIVANYGTEKA